MFHLHHDNTRKRKVRLGWLVVFVCFFFSFNICFFKRIVLLRTAPEDPGQVAEP